LGSVPAPRLEEEVGCIALGASVRGIVHLLRDLPNQDAVWWSRPTMPGGPVAVAVADGHGSPHHPRSGEGAQLAVAVAVALIEDWLRSAPADDSWQSLPAAIQGAWLEAVADHLAEFPIDCEMLAPADGGAWLYGTTLLAAGSFHGRTLCLQIGDGDILALRPDGTVFWPLPESPGCFDNVTDSLCQDDAAEHFRVALIEEGVVLLLLATDGYGNSYEDDEAFEQIAPDYLALLKRVGAQRVAEGLPGWLAEITRIGSGDDITLGLLWTAPG
jgi:serine/threonine protein phosphatase PrpC